MPAYLNDIAVLMAEDHKGIPNLRVANELAETFLRVLRKKIIKDGVLYLDNIGKIEVRRYAAHERRDINTGIRYKANPRNVIKFVAAKSLTKMLNLTRPPKENVE